MKAVTIVIVIVLFLGGIAGGYLVLNRDRAPDAPADTTPVAAEPASADAAQHGDFPEIPAGATMCSTHRVPEVVCPFCNPAFVESAGFCAGHDVPEGLCTRCHPILIAAFKAEGDWCAEHGLPESQCRICNPPAEG